MHKQYRKIKSIKELKPVKKIGKKKDSLSSFGATLSACMIVKDGEEFLPRCLESIKDAVDEIIVVDTGSSDRTVEIAESYKAKVYHHPWNDDFSEARNHSLSYATCDWILTIDADEELEQEDIPLLRRTINSDLYNGVFVAVYNHMPDGLSKGYSQRLYGRGKAHYEGIVHNWIIVEGAVAHTEIRIYHYGYHLSKEKMEAKYERSQKLLENQIEEDPNNIFAWYNLNRIYRNKREFDTVVENGMHALSLKPYQKDTAGTYLMILYDTAYCCLMSERLDEGEALCKEGLDKEHRNLDLLFTLGGIYFKQKRYDDAINMYRKYLRQRETEEESPPNLETYIVDTWSFQGIVKNNIGLCYRLLGDYEKAIDYLKNAITQDDQYLNSYKNLFLCYNETEDFAGAQLMLESAVDAGIADDFAFVKLGDLHKNGNRFDEAIKQYEKAIKMNPDNPDAYNSWGYILLTKGEIDSADLKIKKALELNTDHEWARLNLVKLKLHQGAHQEALEEIDKLVSLGPESAEVYRETGSICVRLKKYEKAIDLYEECIRRDPTDKVAMSNIATCYARLGYLESAQIAYQTALKLDPNYAEAARNLSIIDNVIAKLGEQSTVDATG